MNNIIYYDFNIENPEEVLKGSKAILNALKIFILSLCGEYIHNQNYGGYIYPWVTKRLNDQTLKDIKNAIVYGINDSFTENIKLQNVNVNLVNDMNSQLKINIIGSIVSSNEYFNITETIS